jgi:hypothetical protein
MKIWEMRQQLMEEVNERDNITLSIGKKKYPARIAGSKLDYPFIWARHEDGHDIDCEITWWQVQQMKEGTLTNIRKS